MARYRSVERAFRIVKDKLGSRHKKAWGKKIKAEKNSKRGKLSRVNK